MSRTQVVVDVETTSLTPGYDTATGVIWELALVELDGGGRSESLWRIQPDELEMASASAKALEVGRFAERTAGMLPSEGRLTNLAVPGASPRWSDPGKLAGLVADVLRDVTLIGSNPGFDAGFLAAFLGYHAGIDVPPWHYRLRDICSMAHGYLSACVALGVEGRDGALGCPDMDAGTDEFAKALGLDLSKYDRHSALGDCRLVADMLDVIEGAPR